MLLLRVRHPLWVGMGLTSRVVFPWTHGANPMRTLARPQMAALKSSHWVLTQLRAAKVKTQTSATSPDSQPVPSNRLTSPGQRGFTLIELLVVIAIAAMLVALVPSSFDKLREVSQYRDTVRALMVDLRQARQQAISSGKPVVFRLDVADRRFGVQGRPFTKLPSSLEMKATVGTSGVPEKIGQTEIIFLPEGGATGGAIELVRQSGAGVRIRIDWLFGRVTQEPRDL